ncbi:MAG: GNAT family N-acetyltransferase [Clostridiales bacterium]|nr:GNAT family N-acetyltransferase [Clostridiales bacterium]
MQTAEKARFNDLTGVLALYRSLIGTEGCAWNEFYPSEDDIRQDIARDGLYLLRTDKGEIIAACALGPDPELDEVDGWDSGVQNPMGLMRMAVRKDCQRQGLAGHLLAQVERDAARQGVDSIRLLAAQTNPPAIALYERAKYRRTGTAHMYGLDWFCYEKLLK